MHPLAELAKSAVETFVTRGETIAPTENMPPQYIDKRAGVFVTITQNGELRGCIGTHAPTQKNIATETIHNAIEAATSDPRFTPVEAIDLASLKYEVYILEKLEPVEVLTDLDPKVFGVFVIGMRSNGRGLLLPGLEGIDTIKQQLSIACEKAGINPTQEKLAIYRFGAEKVS